MSLPADEVPERAEVIRDALVAVARARRRRRSIQTTLFSPSTPPGSCAFWPTRGRNWESDGMLEDPGQDRVGARTLPRRGRRRRRASRQRAQHVFYEDESVLTCSVHVDPAAGWFPHFMGFADERGAGGGEGANLNVPVDPGRVGRGEVVHAVGSASISAGTGSSSGIQRPAARRAPSASGIQARRCST